MAPCEQNVGYNIHGLQYSYGLKIQLLESQLHLKKFFAIPDYSPHIFSLCHYLM